MNKLLLSALGLILSSTAYAGTDADLRADRTSEATAVFSPVGKNFAPLKTTPSEDDYPMVTEAPAGTTVTYLEDANVYFQMFGVVSSTTDVGITREVVFCEDGTVWFKDFLSGVSSPGYVKGTREGDKIRINFPQALKYITDYTNNTTTTAYVFRLKHGVDDPTDFSIYPIDEQYVEFSINEDNSLITWDDANDFIGMCTFNGGWYGIGAWNYAFRKLDATLVDYPPTGVAREDWTIFWDGIPEVYLQAGYRDVKVAVDDANSEVYIGGLLQTSSDMITWVKGTLNDGKATFKSGQYLGLNDYDEYTYFMGAVGKVVDHPVFHVPSLDAAPLAELVFDYNAETKTLQISEDGHMISLNRGPGAIYGDYLLNPVVQMQMADKIDAAPKNPKISSFTDWGGGAGMFTFFLPSINVNNMLLDTDNIFYNFYLNGEVYTLTKEDYPQLGFNSLTDIPYAYSFYDLVNYNGSVTLYWYIEEEINSLGVCSFYENPTTGERYYSDLVTYNLTESGTNCTLNEEAIISTEWYDLTGRRLACPQKGLCIKLERFANGKTHVTKIIF